MSTKYAEEIATLEEQLNTKTVELEEAVKSLSTKHADEIDKKKDFMKKLMSNSEELKKTYNSLLSHHENLKIDHDSKTDQLNILFDSNSKNAAIIAKLELDNEEAQKVISEKSGKISILKSELTRAEGVIEECVGQQAEKAKRVRPFEHPQGQPYCKFELHAFAIDWRRVCDALFVLKRSVQFTTNSLLHQQQKVRGVEQNGPRRGH